MPNVNPTHVKLPLEIYRHLVTYIANQPYIQVHELIAVVDQHAVAVFEAPAEADAESPSPADDAVPRDASLDAE